MGCDIHMYKEVQVAGEWVSADKWSDDEYEPGRKEVSYKDRFTDRNYKLFGMLVDGVRSSSPFSFKPRGLPHDVTDVVKEESDGWGVDGHSHSYLFLHELLSFRDFLKTQTVRISGMKHPDELAALQKTIDAGAPDWDLLFPYCGWTNSSEYVEFALDVPASFYVGTSLQTIIDGFDEVRGDNPRIVFWFDN